MSTSAPPVHRLDDATLAVEGVRFSAERSFGGNRPDHFMVLKPMELLEKYAELLATFVGANIVELGVYEGGSAALAACLAKPAKLVAIDLEPQPPAALVELIEQQRLSSSIRLHLGVDQGDYEQLQQILDDEFGDEPLDLVVDDASHLYGPTLASFERVFPRVRPGGLFIIEDWRWHDNVSSGFRTAVLDPSATDHQRALDALGSVVADAPDFAQRLGDLLRDAPPDVVAQFEAAAAEASGSAGAAPRPADEVAAAQPDTPGDEPPLTRLALELVLARAWSGDVVDEVMIDSNWTAVRRGPADLDPATFRLHDHIGDPGGLLAPLE
jgi:predicted O-methyltransferase YrrM